MLDIQPTHLFNEWISLVPLESSHFDKLYEVAADPLIWEQHPNKNRYKKDVFEIFFKGAIESKGAFMLIKTSNGEPIGSSRFCNYNPIANSIEIGYTFFSRNCWGKPYNFSAKNLMINYAFQFVDNIIFHIGAGNIRSQKAIEKIGAIKIAEEVHEYYGEDSSLNYVYEIKKQFGKSINKIMKNKFIIALIVIITSFNFCFAQTNSSNRATYQCIPCGYECDKATYQQPGVCKSCNMELVNTKSIVFKTIQPNDICNYIKTHPNVVLLDVRTIEEFAGKSEPNFGTLKNAINIPVQELEAKIATIQAIKNKAIIVYCSHSHRSLRASYLLTQNGFTNVTNMAGGMSVITSKECMK